MITPLRFSHVVLKVISSGPTLPSTSGSLLVSMNKKHLAVVVVVAFSSREDFGRMFNNAFPTSTFFLLLFFFFKWRLGCTH